MTKLTNYCLGFAFNGDMVALILKRKPEWQAGKFNGIGGKVEEGEMAIEAMVREFKEETGYSTEREDWKYIGFMFSEEWYVSVFVTYDVKLDELKTTTDEPVAVKDIRDIYHLECVPNLRWLVPFAKQYAELNYDVELRKKQ